MNHDLGSDREVALKIITERELQPIAIEKLKMEKICCKIVFSDNKESFFQIDADDMFLKMCAMAPKDSLDLSDNSRSLQSTNRFTRFFGDVYINRVLQQICESSYRSQVAVISFESILSELVNEWLEKNGSLEYVSFCTNTMRGIFRRFCDNSCKRVPLDHLKHIAAKEWQTIKELLPQYGVKNWQNATEIRIGFFANSVSYPIFTDTFVQSVVKRETDETWINGLHHLQDGFELLLQKSTVNLDCTLKMITI